MVKKKPISDPLEILEAEIVPAQKGITVVPDKEIVKIIQRCIDYQNAGIDIKMHEQIISIIEELKNYRASK